MSAQGQRIIARTDGHLRQLVKTAMQTHGPSCNLNHIDVSRVTNFERLFHNKPFIGDISGWNMARAIHLGGMFKYCPFDGDISNWDVGNAQVMVSMFEGSSFKGDISKWNVARVKWAGHMFAQSQFNGDLSLWRMPALESATGMFEKSLFNGDVSQWGPKRLRHVLGMFNTPHFHGNLSHWALPIQDTSTAFIHMMAPGFCGALPRFERCHLGHMLYPNMLAPKENFHEYLLRTPFSHVHATQLLAQPTACAWATSSLRQWASEQVSVGLAVGLTEDELVTWMVEQRQATSLSTGTNGDILHYPF